MNGNKKMRTFKTKMFSWKIFPIAHSIIYHYQKAKKSFFEAQKSLRVLKLQRIFIDRVVFRFHSDRALFRFLIDMILFRVLSDRVFIDYSVLGSSSGSVVIDSSLGLSVLFSAMPLFFY